MTFEDMPRKTRLKENNMFITRNYLFHVQKYSKLVYTTNQTRFDNGRLFTRRRRIPNRKTSPTDTRRSSPGLPRKSSLSRSDAGGWYPYAGSQGLLPERSTGDPGQSLNAISSIVPNRLRPATKTRTSTHSHPYHTPQPQKPRKTNFLKRPPC